jgi:hypothetical protein
MNNKKIQLSILTIFLAATLVGSVAAFGVSSVYADEKKKDYDKEIKHYDKDINYDKYIKYSANGNGNSAEQVIEQAQLNSQNSQCVSGVDTLFSCNNVGLQFQNNDGNLALGQQ